MKNRDRNKGFEKLKEAFDLTNEKYLESLEYADESPDSSQDYERKMKKFIRMQKNPYAKKIIKSVKIIAMVAFAFLLTFNSLKPIDAGHQIYYNFFKNKYPIGECYSIDEKITENAPKEIETLYELNTVPDGYVKLKTKSFSVNNYKAAITYWERDGFTLAFEQTLLTGFFTQEKKSEEKIIYEGNTTYYYYYYADENQTAILWHNGEYRFNIYIDEKLSSEKMMEMALSVKQATE